MAEVDRFCYGRLRLFGLYIRVSVSKEVRDAAAAARTLLDSFQTQMLYRLYIFQWFELDRFQSRSILQYFYPFVHSELVKTFTALFSCSISETALLSIRLHADFLNALCSSVVFSVSTCQARWTGRQLQSWLGENLPFVINIEIMRSRMSPFSSSTQSSSVFSLLCFFFSLYSLFII